LSYSDSIEHSEGCNAMFFLYLDTQVFDGNAYDFQNKHFRQLVALAEAGEVRLLMPEVTKREIESHIVAKAKDVYAALEKLRKGFARNLRVPPFDAIAKATTEDAIMHELVVQFQAFCEAVHVEEISLAGLDVAAVLDDYFEKRPPFGDGKKKSEFPDAFTAQLLTKWCEGNKRKAVIISGDTDWSGVNTPQIEVLDHIAKFLARFPDPILARKLLELLQEQIDIKKKVKKAFEDLEFSDPEYHTEICAVTAGDVEVGDLYVTDIKDGIATVEFDVDISYSAAVSGSTIYRRYKYGDYEDDSRWVNGHVTGSKSATASIEIYFDEDDPNEIDYSSVSLSTMCTNIDVKELFDD